MAKKSDINPAAVKRLRQVADGVEGSEGEVTLAPQDYSTFKLLGGKVVEGEKEGKSVQVACKDLCAVVKKAPESDDEPDVAPAEPQPPTIVPQDKGAKKK
jgi:hypothetical protein